MKRVYATIISIIILIIGFYILGTSSSVDKILYKQIIKSTVSRHTSADTISIMSFNIGWLSGMTNNKPVHRSIELYKNKLDSCISFLKYNRQDIIAFQEIDFNSNRSFLQNQADSILKNLQYFNGAVAINWDKRYVPFPGINPSYFFGKTISGQYVMSDLEIIENDFTRLIKPINAPFYYKAFYLDRLIQKTKLKTKNGELMILNVHLEAFDQETRNNHIKEAILQFNKYKNKMPTILLGDFNSPQDTLGTRNALLSKLISMNNVGMAIPDSTYKVNKAIFNTYSSGNPHTKIDFIFYTSDKIKKIDAGVFAEIGEVSDHLPVWMKFVVR
ncbi:MAG: endonuclease/exonuclease/phosphatase family protein [Flavobacteriales bacterium]|nr:endonuclease/exonuclease/phosphatase family protein [Flavobacteriales bacterium]